MENNIMQNYCKKHKIEKEKRLINTCECENCHCSDVFEYYCPKCEKIEKDNFKKEIEKNKIKILNLLKKEGFLKNEDGDYIKGEYIIPGEMIEFGRIIEVIHKLNNYFKK